MRCGGGSGWTCCRGGPGVAGAGPDRQHCGRADGCPWYPNGFVFVHRVRWGRVADPDEQPPWPFPDWAGPDPLDPEPLPDALLRFGVQFADGRKVTNLDMYPFVPGDLPPDQPVLVEGGGEGSEVGRLGGAPSGTWGWPSSLCPARAARLHLQLAGTPDPFLADGDRRGGGSWGRRRRGDAVAQRPLLWRRPLTQVNA